MDYEKLSNKQKVLLRMQEKKISLTTKQVSEICGISYSNVGKYLKELESDGLIVRNSVQIGRKPFIENRITELGLETDVEFLDSDKEIKNAIKSVRENEQTNTKELFKEFSNELMQKFLNTKLFSGLNDTIPNNINRKDYNNIQTILPVDNNKAELKKELRTLIQLIYNRTSKKYKEFGYNSYTEIKVRISEIIDQI